MKKIILALMLILTITLTSCTTDSEESKHIAIAFETNGGNAISPMSVENLFLTTMVEEPVKEGFDFAGWYTDEELTIFVGETTEIKEDTTLYARWEVTYYEYTVTLNIEGTQTTMTAEYGNLNVIQRPEKEGYTFVGWYTEETFENRYSYAPTIDEDFTLYAKFEIITGYVFVVFHNYVIDKINVTYGDVIELGDDNLTDFDLDGFTFEGFYSEHTFENEITSVTVEADTIVVYANYTLTAEDIDLTELAYYDLLDSSNPVVTINVKDMGSITLELFPDISPNTVNNFIKYIQDGDYSDSTFHRVIAGFMIQGGIVENSNCPIEGEFLTNGYDEYISHTRGILSMARTNDKNSATSQFFIVHRDSTHLDGQYASFGGMTSGFNVLDLIALQYKDTNDKPAVDVIIESMTVELNGYVVDDVVCAE